MTRPIPDDLSKLASFYRRWEPQEDRRREISDDLKELFSEAKGNGFNSKAMRKAFAAQYRLDHEDSEQREAREQTDDETELYLSALARVRESDDLAGAVDQLRAVSDNAGVDFSGWNNSTREFENNEPAHELRQNDGGSEDAPASVDTNEPETADELQKAAGETIPSNQPGARPEASPEIGGKPEATNSDAPTHASDDEGNDPALTAEADPSASATNSVAAPKLKMNPEFFNAPHPSCKRPSFCGGNSNLALCDTCKAAPANDDFARIPVLGSINQ